MTTRTGTTRIVNEERFILATRDTGYRSTAAAVAELVDNSIQAKSTIIRIFITQAGNPNDRAISIAVLDNGEGMTADTLATAMQFAGSSRFNDRRGLGRFGMGLPNSSVSQARRVDVYTWQDRNNVISTYLDVDEISDGELKYVPKPHQAELPGWVEKFVRRKSGTLVEWTKCDRLDHRKASTIAEKLIRPLSQRFRYFLWSGNKIYVNDTLLEPHDPLFLQPVGDLEPAKQFGDDLIFEFRVPSEPQRTSTVRVRFSEFPIAAWYDLEVEQKRQLGIVKGAGVSIVRSEREIDFGWYFLGGKRKENYDDWWRCEISFAPDLDELFGVSHSKQDINPSSLLKAELGQQLENIAQTLNSRARHGFAGIKRLASTIVSPSEAIATSREPVLPIVVHSEVENTRRSHTSSTKCKAVRIQREALHTPEMYVASLKSDGTLLVTLNDNHPYCEGLPHNTTTAKSKKNTHEELLLTAMARAELSIPDATARLFVRRYLMDVANILASYLGD